MHLKPIFELEFSNLIRLLFERWLEELIVELLKTSFQVETAALKFSLKSTWWGQIEIFPPNQVQSWAHLFPSHSIGRLGGHFCIVHHDGNAFICLFKTSIWYYQPGQISTIYLGWIPRLGIDITFFYGRFLYIKKL